MASIPPGNSQCQTDNAEHPTQGPYRAILRVSGCRSPYREIVTALVVKSNRFSTGELVSKSQSDLIWAMMAGRR